MGAYLSEPIKTKETQTGQNQKYQFCACGMQGWRTSMEDAHIASLDIEPDTHIFGVFDGHGGREMAKFVSKYFISELQKNNEYKKGNYEEALKQNFFRMDEMARDEKNKAELLSYRDNNDYEISMAGCTANVILIKNNTLYCANAGDSRCCISNNGKLIKLSKDHKPTDAKERSRIMAAGGAVYNERVNGNLNLSRALGDFEYKQDTKLSESEQLITALPDLRKREFDKNDEFIIIGCDGIWETQTSDEIIKWTKKNLSTKSVQQTTQEMLDWLIAPDTSGGTGCDNMSVILIKIKQ